MRYILTFLTAVMLIAGCSTNEDGVKDNGKTAILMVHFGTTHDDTRALTIDAINQKVKDSFPECDVFEAYTSRIIIKRLKERGIEKQTPSQVLEKRLTNTKISHKRNPSRQPEPEQPLDVCIVFGTLIPNPCFITDIMAKSSLRSGSLSLR